MTRAELRSKFEECAKAVLSPRETTEVVNYLYNLEQAKEINGLMDIIRG